MDIRHLVTKNINGDILYTKDIVTDGGTVIGHKSKLTPANSTKTDDSNLILKQASDKLASLVFTEDEPNTLNKLLTSELNNYIEENNETMQDIACKMFDDVSRNKSYTPYIPVVISSGCMVAQIQDNKPVFNEDGTVSLADFLDGLNSIYLGANSNLSRRISLDNVSTADDYFNEGYQACIRGISSPFFNLYKRKELLEPITRLELAYITVLCWDQFLNKFNNLYGGKYYLGISFDWEAPGKVLSFFRDGYDYKVSQTVVSTEYNTASLNIKDYKPEELSMTDYKLSLKEGQYAIPMPMFMSLLELSELGVFNFPLDRLDPLKEVSRGEFCYFIYQLTKIMQK